MQSFGLTHQTKAIGFLFDLDGLLVDSERMSYEAWLTIAGRYGVDIAPVYPSLIGKGLEARGRILEAHFGPDLPLKDMRDQKDALFRRMMERQLAPKAGALELLEHLSSAGHRTALVTSSLEDEATFRLSKAGIAHTFTLRVYGGEVQRGKPAPDIYLRAAERLGVAPNSCVALEDSYAGVQAALSAGMLVYMIPDLLPPEPWMEPAGVRIRESLGEVLSEVNVIPQIRLLPKELLDAST